MNRTKKFTQHLQNTKIQLLIIIILTFLAYSNIFANGFVLDDNTFIVDWPLVHNLGHIPELIRGESPSGHNGVYRPVSSIISAVYHQLWGTNTFGYHGAATFFHILATVLVYFITRQLILTPGVKKMQLHPKVHPGGEENAVTPPGWALGGGCWLPFLAALLFGLHPIHIEAVTFMTASIGGLPAAVFFFASFYLYISRKRRPLLWLASLLLALLAFFAYELTLVLPLLLVIYEFYFGNWRQWRANLKKWLPYFVLAIFYVLVRAQMLGIDNFDNRYTRESFYFVQLLMVKVHALYLFLLVLPFGLSIDHIIPPGYETYRTAINDVKVLTGQSLLDAEILFAGLILISLIFALWKTRKKYPLFSFGISWFFICLLPIANLFRLPTVFAERYIYLASFGFILSFTYGLFLFLKKTKGLFYTVILLIVIFGGRTYLRNMDWYNQSNLWLQAATVYPKSVLPYYSMGNQQYNNGFVQEAGQLYLKALENQPGFYPARFSLGYIYQQTGNFTAMEQEYRKVLQLKPDFLEAYINLSDYYISNKKEDEALQLLKQAILAPINPKSKDEKADVRQSLSKIYGQLGIIYQGKGQPIAAYINFQKALKLFPENQTSQSSLRGLISKNPNLQQFIQGSGEWETYRLDGISFQYPKGWKIKKEEEGISISSFDNYFKILIDATPQPDNFAANDFIIGQKDSFGKLEKEGYIRLGNFSEVFARQWNANGILTAQIFIFDSGKIIKIHVAPAETELKGVLDKFLGSVKMK